MQDDLLLGGSVPSVGPKVDPRNYETVKCSKCGSIRFTNEVILKRISGMEIGQGTKPMLIPLQILTCANCGAILDDDIKGYKLEDDLNLTKENKDNKSETSLVL